MIRIELPYPPSANRYYRHVGYRTLISREGRKYRAKVCSLLASASGQRRSLSKGRIALCMDAFPPDRRRRDLDNLLKCTQDSLAHAGVYEDDSQIDVLVVVRSQAVQGGRVVVRLEELPLRRCALCGREWSQDRKDTVR